MEEKKSGGLLVVVALLCLLIGGVGGYFVSVNYLNKGKNNNVSVSPNVNITTKQNDTNKVNVYSVTDPKVSNLIKNITYDSVMIECSENNIWYYAKDTSVKVSDIDSSMAFTMVSEYNDLNNDKKIGLDEIEKEIQKILGKDYKFDSTKSIEICSHNGYDSKTKTLVPAKNEQCGGTCAPQIVSPSYKMVKAVDTDGTLEIDVKVVFENNDNKVYSDYAKKNVIATYNDENEEYLDSQNKVLNRDEVLNKGSDYKFTFKLEDGNYVFVSSEPLK